jgi:hypothetical protein
MPTRARRLAAFALSITVFGFVLPTRASAAPIAFEATLSLRFGSLPGLFVRGTGIGESSGPGGTASIPAGTFGIHQISPISPPLASLFWSLAYLRPGQINQKAPLPGATGTNRTLAFDGSTGTMPLDASIYLLNKASKLVADAAMGVLGVGGQAQFTVVGVTTGTMIGNPYRLGMTTATGRLSLGLFSTVILRGSGFDRRTAGGGGRLQLVSPGMIRFRAIGTVPILSTLTIDFVPEPTTALLFACGLMALGALRRRTAG